MLLHVRTLMDADNSSRPCRQTALIASELSRYNIGIAALSKKSLTEWDGQWLYFFSGRDFQRIPGVGFAVRTKLLQTLPESPVTISERLMTLRIPLAKHRYAAFITVIAWLESMTRLDSSYDFCWLGLDSSHVKKNGDLTRLESCFSQNDSTRVRVIFTKFLSSWWTNPVRSHTKKWAFFASVMIKIDRNFLFCLSSRAMLHFKDQVSPTSIEGDLRLALTEGWAGHNILTPYRGLM